MSDQRIEEIRHLLKAAKLLRDAGHRGSDGYPPSHDRIVEHEQAALAVEWAIKHV